MKPEYILLLSQKWSSYLAGARKDVLILRIDKPNAQYLNIIELSPSKATNETSWTAWDFRFEFFSEMETLTCDSLHK